VIVVGEGPEVGRANQTIGVQGQVVRGNLWQGHGLAMECSTLGPEPVQERRWEGRMPLVPPHFPSGSR